MKKIASNRNYRLLKIKNTIQLNKLGQEVAEEVYKDPQTWGEYLAGGAIDIGGWIAGAPSRAREAFDKELLKRVLCTWANEAAEAAAEAVNSKETIHELREKGFEAVRVNDKIIAQCILKHCAPILYKSGCKPLTDAEVEKLIEKKQQEAREEKSNDAYKVFLDALDEIEF